MLLSEIESVESNWFGHKNYDFDLGPLSFKWHWDFKMEMSNWDKGVEIEFVGFSNISIFIAKKELMNFPSMLLVLDSFPRKRQLLSQSPSLVNPPAGWGNQRFCFSVPVGEFPLMYITVNSHLVIVHTYSCT